MDDLGENKVNAGSIFSDGSHSFDGFNGSDSSNGSEGCDGFDGFICNNGSSGM